MQAENSFLLPATGPARRLCGFIFFLLPFGYAQVGVKSLRSPGNKMSSPVSSQTPMQFVASPLPTLGLWAQGVVSPSRFSPLFPSSSTWQAAFCSVWRKVGDSVEGPAGSWLTGTVVTWCPLGVFLFWGLGKHQLSRDQSQLTTHV